jgi:predicted metal-dependent HD superfamily phosphohydrolase
MSHHRIEPTAPPPVLALADRPLACAMFHDLFGQLLVAPADRAMLAALWREPWRRYHGAGHAGLLWQRHLAFGGDPGDTVIAHAIAYHDAIYVVGARDNEARSAALWRDHAAALPRALRDAVDGAIMATANHAATHPDPDAQWLVDLDLTPLGEPWDLFIANAAALRAEAGLTDERMWPQQRLFLSRLLALPVLYRSQRAAASLAQAHESNARRNLTRALA